jgi:hypothetical protein
MACKYFRAVCISVFSFRGNIAIFKLYQKGNYYHRKNLTMYRKTSNTRMPTFITVHAAVI